MYPNNWHNLLLEMDILSYLNYRFKSTLKVNISTAYLPYEKLRNVNLYIFRHKTVMVEKSHSFVPGWHYAAVEVTSFFVSFQIQVNSTRPLRSILIILIKISHFPTPTFSFCSFVGISFNPNDF
jgi:hypothetical protein